MKWFAKSVQLQDSSYQSIASFVNGPYKQYFIPGRDLAVRLTSDDQKCCKVFDAILKKKGSFRRDDVEVPSLGQVWQVPPQDMLLHLSCFDEADFPLVLGLGM